MAISWSDELLVMLRPAAAYERLSREARRGSLWQKPVLVAFVIGLALAVSSAGRPTLRLVLDCAVAWSFIPALQVGSVALVAVALGRGALWKRAVELHFLAHLPWSVWILGIATLAVCLPPERDEQVWSSMLVTAAIPFLWSRILSWHLFRRGLGMGAPAALLAVVLHLVLVCGAIAVFFLATGQLGPRIASAR